VSAALAVVAGALAALYALALGNALAAFFWPGVAGQLLGLFAILGGAAALAAGFASGRLRELARRRAPLALAVAGVSACGALAAIGPVASTLFPGPGLGPLSLPLPWIALAALPFVVAGALLGVGGAARGDGRAGWLIAGLGTGALVAAAIAASGLAVRTPWFGGRLLEFTPSGGRAWSLGIDRRLAEDVIAPSTGARLAFFPRRPRDGRVDVLLVGFPDGPVLASLLRRTDARVTVLEEDGELVAAVLARWPELAEARAAGRVRFVPGNPRWSLARSAERYDLAILSEGWSFGAYLSHTLNRRRDHRWTVEGVRAVVDHLERGGFLMVERTNIGRIVATLREVAGVPGEEFRHRVVVFGGRGRLSSQCWYRAAGLADGALQVAARKFSRENGIPLLYRPSKYPMNSFYDPLVTEDRVRGLYFSTPLDLSPALDERPFFDNVERLVISPLGRSMPEELVPREAQSPIQVIPSGDRGAWGALVLGAALAALAIVAAWRAGRGGAPGAAPALAVLAPAGALGVAAALALTAFDAWAQWLGPSPPASRAAVGALLAGAGAGWLLARRPLAPAWPLGALACVMGLYAAVGYRAGAAIPLLGAGASALVLCFKGAAVGALLGVGLRAGAGALERPASPAPGAAAGAFLAAASLAWNAGELAATHFGYRLLWALGAVAALAAVRAIRGLPPAPTT
jgi:hypothetical protein